MTDLPPDPDGIGRYSRIPHPSIERLRHEWMHAFDFAGWEVQVDTVGHVSNTTNYTSP